MSLVLKEMRDLDDGLGFVFHIASQRRPIKLVYATWKTLIDENDGRHTEKIGVSLSSGCSVGCKFCFTQGMSRACGLLTDEIVRQVDVVNTYTRGWQRDHARKKISFKQMGDPIRNFMVLDAIRELDRKYPDRQHVVSTPGPEQNAMRFFDGLRTIRDNGVDIRLQFSCHTTSDEERKLLCPCTPLLTLAQLGEVARTWGERVTLNFMILRGFTYNAKELAKHFSPETAFIKLNFVDPNPFTRFEEFRDASSTTVRRFAQALTDAGFIHSYRHRPDAYEKGGSRRCEPSE